jgi:hypothetical protein
MRIRGSRPLGVLVGLLALVSVASSSSALAAQGTDKLWCQVKAAGDGMELAVFAADNRAGQTAAAAACGYAMSLGDFYAISSGTPAAGRTLACQFSDEDRGVMVTVWWMNAISQADQNASDWCYKEAVNDRFTVEWPDGSITPPGGP